MLCLNLDEKPSEGQTEHFLWLLVYILKYKFLGRSKLKNKLQSCYNCKLKKSLPGYGRKWFYLWYEELRISLYEWSTALFLVIFRIVNIVIYLLSSKSILFIIIHLVIPICFIIVGTNTPFAQFEKTYLYWIAKIFLPSGSGSIRSFCWLLSWFTLKLNAL